MKAKTDSGLDIQKTELTRTLTELLDDLEQLRFHTECAIEDLEHVNDMYSARMFVSKYDKSFDNYKHLKVVG